MKTFGIFFLVFLSFFITVQKATATEPASTNYKLDNYSFGAGGTQNSTSTNYKVMGIAGEVEFGKTTSTNFSLGAGLQYLQQANVPPAPTLTNPSSYYNKLKIVIATGGNPTDSTYAIAVSPDNFSSTKKYLQADGTLGASPVWQSYAAWGSGTGTTLAGLSTGTTYTVKVAVQQGKFTQTQFSPTAQAATVTPTLSFSLSSNAVSLGSLTPGSVITGGSTVTVTMTSNSNNGATVYGYDSNAGLLSSSTSYRIAAVTSDLSSASEGYGVRGTAVTQTSGGPMEILSPYNGAGSNVGILNTTEQIIFDSTNQPVTSGQGTFELRAKSSNTAKAATDYADTITLVGAATF